MSTNHEISVIDSLPAPRLGHEITLYSTTGMERQDWLLARKRDRTVGASAIGAIMRHSPYATPMDAWSEITGRGRVLDDEERIAMEIGIACEPQIGLVAADVMQLPLERHPWVLRHPKIEGFTCNLDFTALMFGERVIVETKWGGWRAREYWLDLEEHGTPESCAGTPLMSYWLQVQSQLAITGLQRGMLVGIIGEEAATRMLLASRGLNVRPSPKDVFVISIARHEPTIAAIEGTAARFHEKFILTDSPPPAVGARDLDVLRRTFVASKPAPRPMTRIHELAEVCAQYKAIHAEYTAADMKKKDMKAMLMSALSQRKIDEAVCGDWLLSYRENFNGQRSINVRPYREPAPGKTRPTTRKRRRTL